MSGICRFTAYVQIAKEYDGEGKLAALAALASDSFVKLAVVVDDDIDIYNDAEVLWAIATRTQPDRATFFVQDAAVSRLDPASYSIWSRWEKDTMNTKWAIDATKPVEAPFEERADVPAPDLGEDRPERVHRPEAEADGCRGSTERADHFPPHSGSPSSTSTCSSTRAASTSCAGERRAGIDMALPCYDRALATLDSTAWPVDLTAPAADLRERVADYRRTLQDRDVTSASAVQSRMMSAFDHLRDLVGAWPAGLPLTERRRRGARRPGGTGTPWTRSCPAARRARRTLLVHLSMPDLSLVGGIVVTLDEAGTVLPRGTVIIDDGLIEAVPEGEVRTARCWIVAADW